MKAFEMESLVLIILSVYIQKASIMMYFLFNFFLIRETCIWVHEILKTMNMLNVALWQSLPCSNITEIHHNLESVDPRPLKIYTMDNPSLMVLIYVKIHSLHKKVKS